jgi:hypothetical protein
VERLERVGWLHGSFLGKLWNIVNERSSFHHSVPLGGLCQLKKKYEKQVKTKTPSYTDMQLKREGRVMWLWLWLWASPHVPSTISSCLLMLIFH